jgi:hypothetical protein
MDEEYDALFRLPINPATEQAKPIDNIVAEASKITPAEAPTPRILTPVRPAAKLSDQALFDELNSVSEELIACRNQILGNIS